MRMLATGSQPEPSAKAPCTKTTFLIRCAMTILLCSKDPLGPFDLESFANCPNVISATNSAYWPHDVPFPPGMQPGSPVPPRPEKWQLRHMLPPFHVSDCCSKRAATRRTSERSQWQKYPG